MNTTVIITLASLGGFLWIIAMIRDFTKKTSGNLMIKKFLDYFVRKQQITTDPGEVRKTKSPTAGYITIESLEAELGITPDAYLCDRIARINDALVARREGTKTKKGGTK